MPWIAPTTNPTNKQNSSNEKNQPEQSIQLLSRIDARENDWHPDQPGKHIGWNPDGSTSHYSTQGEPLRKGKHHPT
jgi:hypothetical protein